MYLRTPGPIHRAANQGTTMAGNRAKAPQFGSDPAFHCQTGNHLLPIERGDTKRHEVFQCPAAPGSNWVRPAAFTYYGTSYRMNHCLWGSRPASGPGIRAGTSGRDDRRIPNSPHRTRFAIAPAAHGDYSWYECWDQQAWKTGHGTAASHITTWLFRRTRRLRAYERINVDNRYRLIPFSDLNMMPGARWSCLVRNTATLG